MSKKELLINADPRIRTYTHHCFYHAIVSADDKVSEIPAILRLKDYEKYSWREQTDQLTCTSEGDLLTFHANSWNLGMNQCIYRECQEQDEIEIRIEKQIYTSAWGAINLFVGKQTQIDLLNEDEYIWKYGNYCKEGLTVWNYDQEKYRRMFREEEPFSMILKKDGNHYTFLRRKDQEEQVVFTWDDLERTENKWIGVQVKLKNSDFYEWYFAHYIEIYGNVCVDALPIDYFVNPMKSWQNYETNHFTQYRTIYRDKIACFGLSILEYVKCCINAGHYVEMWLNEGFMDREEDGSPGEQHIHQNLIYGYDDENQQLLVLRTYYGKPMRVTLSYEEFESDDNYNDRNDLIVPTAYVPEYIKFELTPQYLAYSLRNYYEATNRELSMKHCCVYYKKLWGIELLRQLMTEPGIEMLLEDIRISHLLYERAGCMLERIAYLVARKIITQEEANEVEPTIKKAYQVSSKIRNIVLKQRFAQGNSYAVRVKEKLEELYSFEMSYLPRFIQILEQKL